MAYERDRTNKIIRYLTDSGIVVNIGKNKARGHGGVFIYNFKNYRIDLSENLPEDKILSTLIHEYAHYVHYKYDKTLGFPDVFLGEKDDNKLEELINITVKNIPADFARNLFEKKEAYKEKITSLKKIIKSQYPDFIISSPNKIIEKNLKGYAKYLLKYDRIRTPDGNFSVESIKEDFPSLENADCAYIKLKSAQRKIANINSRISKLNKYYNQPSELFARYCEIFFTAFDKAEKSAPECTKIFTDKINKGEISEFSSFYDILR